jgi:hypothetical protein
MDVVLSLALEAPLPGTIPTATEALATTVPAAEVGGNAPAPQ